MKLGPGTSVGRGKKVVELETMVGITIVIVLLMTVGTITVAPSLYLSGMAENGTHIG